MTGRVPNLCAYDRDDDLRFEYKFTLVNIYVCGMLNERRLANER